MTNPPSPRVLFIGLLLVQILFGVNYVISKVIVAAFPPLVWASTRSLVAVVLMGILVDIRGKPHPKGGWKFFLPLIGFALIGVTINQGCFLVGLYYTTPTNSAVLNTLIPVFTLLAVIARGQEQVTFSKVGGFLSALTGVLIILRVEEFRLSSATMVGDLLTLINCLSFGCYLAFSKKFLEKHDRPWATLWMFILGSFGLTMLALPDWRYFEWPKMNAGLWACTVYAIVGGTFLTYLLNNWLLAHVESSRVALFIYLQPLIATIAAVAWFGQEITGRTAFGGCLIFLGVFLATRKAKPKPA